MVLRVQSWRLWLAARIKGLLPFGDGLAVSRFRAGDLLLDARGRTAVSEVDLRLVALWGLPPEAPK